MNILPVMIAAIVDNQAIMSTLSMILVGSAMVVMLFKDSWIKKEVKEIKVIVLGLGVDIAINKEITSRYRDNEAYYSAICDTVVEAVRFVKDEKTKIFMNHISKSINAFSRVILNTDVAKINRANIDLHGVVMKNSIVGAISSRLDEKMRNEYTTMIGAQIDLYLANMSTMLDDIVNDKKKRFRTETMRLVEIMCSEFINLYLKDANTPTKVN